MVMKDMRRIGIQVRNFREAKNISQEELANQAGLATGTIGKIERGIDNPKADTLLRIAHELEVPCQLLFEMSDAEKPPLAPQLHRLFQYARHLNEEELNALCIVARTLQRKHLPEPLHTCQPGSETPNSGKPFCEMSTRHDTSMTHVDLSTNIVLKQRNQKHRQYLSVLLIS